MISAKLNRNKLFDYCLLIIDFDGKILHSREIKYHFIYNQKFIASSSHIFRIFYNEKQALEIYNHKLQLYNKVFVDNMDYEFILNKNELALDCYDNSKVYVYNTERLKLTSIKFESKDENGLFYKNYFCKVLHLNENLIYINNLTYKPYVLNILDRKTGQKTNSVSVFSNRYPLVELVKFDKNSKIYVYNIGGCWINLYDENGQFINKIQFENKKLFDVYQFSCFTNMDTILFNQRLDKSSISFEEINF